MKQINDIEISPRSSTVASRESCRVTMYVQESCAIAKMTAQCAYIWVPEYFLDSLSTLSTPTTTIPNIFHGLLFRSILYRVAQKIVSYRTLSIYLLLTNFHIFFTSRLCRKFATHWHAHHTYCVATLPGKI